MFACRLFLRRCVIATGLCLLGGWFAGAARAQSAPSKPILGSLGDPLATPYALPVSDDKSMITHLLNDTAIKGFFRDAPAVRQILVTRRFYLFLDSQAVTVEKQTPLFISNVVLTDSWFGWDLGYQRVRDSYLNRAGYALSARLDISGTRSSYLKIPADADSAQLQIKAEGFVRAARANRFAALVDYRYLPGYGDFRSIGISGSRLLPLGKASASEELTKSRPGITVLSAIRSQALYTRGAGHTSDSLVSGALIWQNEVPSLRDATPSERGNQGGDLQLLRTWSVQAGAGYVFKNSFASHDSYSAFVRYRDRRTKWETTLTTGLSGAATNRHYTGVSIGKSITL